jgi:pimeloyl-ACP methyl ester carboxylesterase
VSGDRRGGLVLIHGGYHGAWAWERLTPLLDHPALAVDLPGRGAHPAPLDDVTVEACAASVVADVDAAGLDQVVLVAHSLGGITALRAAALLGDRATHLVFVACLVARPGASSLASMPEELQERAAQRLRALDGAASTIDVAHHREQLCNDMDAEQEAFTLARLVPDSLNLFHDPVDWAAATDVPCTYVRILRDRSLAPAMQDHMISILGPGTAVVELDAGHDVMISDPPRLAAVLDDVVGRALA